MNIKTANFLAATATLLVLTSPTIVLAANDNGKGNSGNNGKNSVSTTTFGVNNQDEFVTSADQSLDQDGDDGTVFRLSGTIVSLSTTDNSFTLSNGQTYTLTPEQFSFLTGNGTLVQNGTVQVIGNHSNNGNVVTMLKVKSPTGGPMVMARLHSNDKVNQANVKTNDTNANSVSGFFTHMMSLLSNLLGGGTTENPSPSPSASPSESPSASPSESP